MEVVRVEAPPWFATASITRLSRILGQGQMDRFRSQLAEADPDFGEVIQKIPLQTGSTLPPEWLRCEMLERHLTLRDVGVAPNSKVLEVGSGGHAIATVPLAHALGPNGRVLAVERKRWTLFRTVVAASGLDDRVEPVACDARRLPIRDGAADLAVCIHGIRSLQSETDMVSVFREMLRVAPRILLAESLPIAKTDAQRAHLAMYNLREEVFRATSGRGDDLHYLELPQLTALVERAGGLVKETRTLDVDLPHALAYFPRSMVEAIPRGMRRDDLLGRWDDANALLDRYGADHPPVGMIAAERR